MLSYQVINGDRGLTIYIRYARNTLISSFFIHALLPWLLVLLKFDPGDHRRTLFDRHIKIMTRVCISSLILSS